jgi:hypothetical protein
MATQNDSHLPLPPGERMRIAVLTSGGDSAGMNAAVRGVVKQAIIRSVLRDALTPISFKFTHMFFINAVDARLSLYEKAMRGLYAAIRTRWTKISITFPRLVARGTASFPTFALVTVLCYVMERPIVKARWNI